MSSPFVRVLGVALVVTACGEKPIVEPTPAPMIPEVLPTAVPTPPEPMPTANPPAPTSTLPAWDDVKSSHPEGATNPPSPVLFVTAEPKACFKVWMGGMMPPLSDIREAGGRVVATAAEVPNGTEVQCPPGQPETLIAAYAKVPAEKLPGGSESGPRPGEKGGGPAPKGGN